MPLSHHTLHRSPMGGIFYCCRAGGGGTQRQVHRIGAQNHGVLYGNHNIGVKRAAVFAEAKTFMTRSWGVRRITGYLHPPWRHT